MTLTPTLRRIIYATSFEAGGIVVSTLALMLMAQDGAGSSTLFSILAATCAMGWSMAFNTMFEAWESRQAIRGRSFLRRSVHAVLFEGGLLVILLPLTAWWFDVTLITALAFESVLVALFLTYTWVFTWVFDRLFGLPRSAQ